MIKSLNAWNTSLFVALMGASWLCACTTTTGAPPVAEADFVAQYAEVLCSGSERCCAVAQYPVDHAACVAQARSYWTPDPATGVAMLPYNARNGGECIARIRNNLAASCLDPKGAEATDEAYFCGNVYAGTKGIGESCGSGEACAPSPDGTVFCAGTCTLERSGHEGDSCGAAASLAGDCGQYTHLYCGAENKCKPQRKLGEACAGQQLCERGSICVGDTCVAAGAVGAPCRSSRECALDAFCPANPSVCTLRKKQGEACMADADQCMGGFCSSGRCSAGYTATADFCAGRPPSGN